MAAFQGAAAPAAAALAAHPPAGPAPAAVAQRPPRPSNRDLLEVLTWGNDEPGRLDRWLSALGSSDYLQRPAQRTGRCGKSALRAIVSSFWCEKAQNWRRVASLDEAQAPLPQDVVDAIKADDAAGGVAAMDAADLAAASPIDLFRRSAQLVLGLDWATALDVVDWYLGRESSSSVEGGWDLEDLRHLCAFYYDERRWTLLILRKLFEIDDGMNSGYPPYNVVHPHLEGAVLDSWKRVDAEKAAVLTHQRVTDLSTGAESFVGDLLQLSAAGLPDARHERRQQQAAEVPGETAFANFWRHTELNSQDAGATGSGFLATAQRLRVRASATEPRIAAEALTFLFDSASCDEISDGGYCNVVLALLAEIYSTPRRAGACSFLSFPPLSLS